MALMELVFRCPAHQRRIAFADVASAVRTRAADIEMLIMRAFSAGLIRGNIDGIDQCLDVTWVQPRVMSLEQVEQLRSTVEQWAQRVQGMADFIERASPELFAS